MSFPKILLAIILFLPGILLITLTVYIDAMIINCAISGMHISILLKITAFILIDAFILVLWVLGLMFLIED